MDLAMVGDELTLGAETILLQQDHGQRYAYLLLRGDVAQTPGESDHAACSSCILGGALMAVTDLKVLVVQVARLTHVLDRHPALAAAVLFAAPARRTAVPGGTSHSPETTVRPIPSRVAQPVRKLRR